jgi:hypothetical protein
MSTSNNWEMRLYKLLKESRDDVSANLNHMTSASSTYRFDTIDSREQFLREIDCAIEEFEDDRGIES